MCSPLGIVALIIWLAVQPAGAQSNTTVTGGPRPLLHWDGMTDIRLLPAHGATRTLDRVNPSLTLATVRERKFTWRYTALGAIVGVGAGFGILMLEVVRGRTDDYWGFSIPFVTVGGAVAGGAVGLLLTPLLMGPVPPDSVPPNSPDGAGSRSSAHIRYQALKRLDKLAGGN